MIALAAKPGSRHYLDVSMDRTRVVVEEAGWSPGRSRPDLVAVWIEALVVRGRFEMHEAARSFLLEFGGLAWPMRTPNEHLAAFSFNFDPSTAVGEEERFAAASMQVDQHLFPVGEAVNGHVFVARATDGEFFLLMDHVEAVADDPWQLLDQLLGPVVGY